MLCEVAASIEAMRAADCWLIGTNDHQILDVARALSDGPIDLDGALVFHLAGRFVPLRQSLVPRVDPFLAVDAQHLVLEARAN